ncbi:CDP-glucose 4,6-dehydratase [Criibacterium bergeronii]|uniref:CDP-glucose 4,6-dehydratase n=1 Tax=Criibacterium bergeronii TaxID=1871336 RepID=A0A371IIS0_9FIRM|nr:CDP-glucose 4,6-dehydratase [Criibacterium bergeronii]RDY20370.1 CDP-glucose 4,6-dehydratase [Criibacterium bergeronii]TRW25509.1 CDP-glucose 4,6-dehydratase [Criibacterium bergeronii]
MLDILEKYKNKTVLVTGHTGFKGAWLSKFLLILGANVIGYSLEPPTKPSLYEMLELDKQIVSIIGDIRDFERLSKTFKAYNPEIVFHLAAQPIVRTSYKEPRATYETNVMGTVNVCECIRNHACVKSFLNITTDKVYKNNEWVWGYREDDSLDGFDPYSNSKSCSELVTHSYKNSFFNEMNVSASTARAGNVIGGGDFADNRIIPDCVRAVKNRDIVSLRNPYSIRPYQHVLDPLIVYLTIAILQMDDKAKQGFYNIGPSTSDCVHTIELVKLFAKYYGSDFKYEVNDTDHGPHEANFLRLDTSLIHAQFGYSPIWDIDEAIKQTVEWTKIWLVDDSPDAINKVVENQIKDFLNHNQMK